MHKTKIDNISPHVIICHHLQSSQKVEIKLAYSLATQLLSLSDGNAIPILHKYYTAKRRSLMRCPLAGKWIK